MVVWVCWGVCVWVLGCVLVCVGVCVCVVCVCVCVCVGVAGCLFWCCASHNALCCDFIQLMNPNLHLHLNCNTAGIKKSVDWFFANYETARK